MAKKKIMQINITCGVGSTGRLSESLFYATKDKGYDVCFAYSTFNPTIKNAFRIENKFQNYLRRGLNRYFGYRQKHSIFGTKRLIRYIKREKPDLIHVHNVQQNAVDYRLFFDYLKKSGIPIVFTLHDCWSFTGGCYHFTQIGCNLYESGCKSCLANKTFDDVKISPEESYSIKGKLIGGNDNIYPVCVSDWLRIEATKSYMGRMKNPPITIYNGIDISTFYPRQSDKLKDLGVNKSEFVILGVASFWNENKGLSLFIELSKKLDFEFKIILVGNGLDSVKALNDERFIILDRTDGVSELAEIYSVADVFINASLEETFGLTTAEALACGTPAIVFNSTACPEVIDKKTGVIAEYGVSGLISAIMEIKKNGKAFYSKNCVKRVEENFTKEKMNERYLQVYGNILNED